MIKNLYALDNEQNLIHISQVEKEKKNKFLCLSCGAELIARKGNIKLHHFAHKRDSNCNYETYLHKLAKLKFISIYKECINKKTPFYLELTSEKICTTCEKVEPYNLSCKLEDQKFKFDLTKKFDIFTEEKNKGGFIADVLLESSSSNDTLFIEFAVTHFCEDKKYNSSNKIVEIFLETEKDLEFLNDHIILESNAKISYYNFKTNTIKKCFYDRKQCKEMFNTFFVFESGKSLLVYKPIKEIDAMLNKKVVYVSFIKEEDYYYNYNCYGYEKCIAEVASKGVNIKNCFICRYRAINDNYCDENDNPIFCKFRKIVAKSNEASQCGYFRKEEKYIKEYLEE